MGKSGEPSEMLAKMSRTWEGVSVAIMMSSQENRILTSAISNSLAKLAAKGS